MSPKRTTPAKPTSTKSRRSANTHPKGKETETRSARQSAPSPIAAKKASSKGRQKGNGAGKANHVAEYRHDEATRKNNPPAKIAAEGTVPVMGKIRYQYSPRLAPVLRFDPTGAPDALPELLQEVQRRALTPDETKLLASALRNQEPWLEWANKREKRHFEVDPVALHIHERVSPQAILRVAARQDVERSLFADPEQTYNEAVQFYRHEMPWTNRLILGDSLQVMTSLAKREDLAGKVQMIYMDPPYGIKFASNFQPEITKRKLEEKDQDLTRELETVKAYRDTWHLGIHSYLSYLQDRLMVARELLSVTGSLFVQISDENVHRVRNLLDEVFGKENQVATIAYKKAAPVTNTIKNGFNYLLWYARNIEQVYTRKIYRTRGIGEGTTEDPKKLALWLEMPNGFARTLTTEEKREEKPLPEDTIAFRADKVRDTGGENEKDFPLLFEGETLVPGAGFSWRGNPDEMRRLIGANRIIRTKETLAYKFLMSDSGGVELTSLWEDTAGKIPDMKYVVQTNEKLVSRCVFLTTRPGDLVLDPTCGSGTTAVTSENFGRRWITIDTSRVALSVARQRILTARFDYFNLKDSTAGLKGDFRYQTFPKVSLKGIAKNQNLEPVLLKHQMILDGNLESCNGALDSITPAIRSAMSAKSAAKIANEGKAEVSEMDRRRWDLPEPGKAWEHWQVPFDTDTDWPQTLQDAVVAYRTAWRAKMDEVNACIAANAEQEELVDQPEVVRGVTRVSGPFTVEAVQPPEMSLGEVKAIADQGEFGGAPEELESFPAFQIREVEWRPERDAQNLDAYLDQMLRYLKMDGVRFPNNKQMHFHRLEQVLDGSTIHAEGRWANGDADLDPEGKANVAVVFGPQYGPVTAKQVEDAIRQASRLGYDHLVIAGFSFDGAATAVISEAGHPKLKIHQAHIRPDVNPGMEGLLREQPGSQLFSVFGLPRVRVESPNGDNDYVVEMEGVDIYDPLKNLTLPTNADKVAAWFLDGDYDGRCFCITQAFFPDKSAWDKLSKALTGVVDPGRFEALSGTRSLPFPAGKHKCVAVKVIDPRGNEVMTVNRLEASRGR
jgi:adenine-specific DNA-methyltransferase